MINSLLYRCTFEPIATQLDIYSAKQGKYQYKGNLTGQLDLLGKEGPQRESQIQEATGMGLEKHRGLVEQDTSKQDSKLIESAPKLPAQMSRFKVNTKDTISERISKVISFVALAPVTTNSIISYTGIDPSELNTIIEQYLQVYQKTNSFIFQDRFPYLSYDEPGSIRYILKDKTYKELKPWQKHWYSDDERSEITRNINNALTRLGYLETHPIRRKICEGPLVELSNSKKGTLGGGMLVRKNVKPQLKKAATAPVPSDGENGAFRPKTEQAAASDLSKKEILPTRPLFKSSSKDVSLSGKLFQCPSVSSSDSFLDERNLRKRKSSPLREAYSVLTDQQCRTTLQGSFLKDKKLPGPAVTDEDAPEPVSKRYRYFYNLAVKFRMQYEEYAKLYHALDEHRERTPDFRRQLERLHRLHHTLLEWKRSLWDFDEKRKQRSNIMALSKHKNPRSASDSQDKHEKEDRDSPTKVNCAIDQIERDRKMLQKRKVENLTKFSLNY